MLGDQIFNQYTQLIKSNCNLGCNVVLVNHVAQCVSRLYCLSWCVNNFHPLPFSAQSEATSSSSVSYRYLIVNSGFKRKPQWQ